MMIKKDNTTTPCIASCMQPLFRNVVAFLRNAGVMLGFEFLPSDVPYGKGVALCCVAIKYP